MELSGRRYRVWDYRVSHDQLLLRSPRSSEHPQNKDVIFVGVQFLSLPTLLDAREVRPANAAELERLRRELRELPDGNVFVVDANQGSFFVIAAGVKVVENDLDFMESSLESFGSAMRGK